MLPKLKKNKKKQPNYHKKFNPNARTEEKEKTKEEEVEVEVTEDEEKDQTEELGRIETLTEMLMDLKPFKMPKKRTPEEEAEEEAEVEGSMKVVINQNTEQEVIEATEAEKEKEVKEVAEQDQLPQEKERNSARVNK